MGMMQPLPVIEMKLSLIYLVAHLAVSFAEGNSLIHQLIDGLHAEDILIFLVIDDAILYLDIREHQPHHLQTGLAFFDDWE